MRFFLLLTVALTTLSCQGTQGTKTTPQDSIYINYKVSAKKVIDSLKLNPNRVFIEINKSASTLYIKINQTVIKSYPVVFGFDPMGDKLMEGDGRTPEDTFKIRSKYLHKNWSRFIWIDYPNASSKKKFEAHKKKVEISKDARIGGEIGIHGVPAGNDALIDEKQNWTLGCISLKTADINEIYDLVKVGTKLVIRQ